MANIVLGAVVDKFGWDVGFILLTAISVFAMLSFILTWNKVGTRNRSSLNDKK